MVPSVELYGRAGCSLCVEAGDVLDRLAPRLGFAVRRVDIEGDADLLNRYMLEIPVVAFDGKEIARAPIRAGALEDRLREVLDAVPRGRRNVD